MVVLVLLLALLPSACGQAAAPDPASIEALLNDTAAQMSEALAEQGRGYSYYTYGTRELLYAVGDLDGDGRPEIAARAVYFLGVGSYDLVDIFADRGDGYQRVDFLNLYHLGLEDEVESLEIRAARLHIGTVGVVRGREVRKSAVVAWPTSVSIDAAAQPTARRLTVPRRPDTSGS